MARIGTTAENILSAGTGSSSSSESAWVSFKYYYRRSDTDRSLLFWVGMWSLSHVVVRSTFLDRTVSSILPSWYVNSALLTTLQTTGAPAYMIR